MKGHDARLAHLHRAQDLRGAMTDAEQHLWRALRGRQMADCKFRRQHPFAGYVLGFVCLEHKLVIELDGGQHQAQADYDAARGRILEDAGFRILRFWNHEVIEQFDAVAQAIWTALQVTPSPPQPSP